jgi:hypothetical protein
MTHRGTNTASASAPHQIINTDEADRLFALMPKPVRDYLLNDSPILYSPAQVLELCDRFPPGIVLHILRQENARETEKAYPGLVQR